jgi:hypothetical protein
MKKTRYLLYCSFLNVGIVRIDCWQEQSTITQTPPPWWCRLQIQRHDNGESAHPTPGSLCGRGWPRDDGIHCLFLYTEYCWWLPCDYLQIDDQHYFFVVPIVSQKVSQRPPTRFTPHAPPLQYPSYREHQLSVGCCVFHLSSGHLRSSHHFLSIIDVCCFASPAKGAAFIKKLAGSKKSKESSTTPHMPLHIIIRC